MSDALNDALLAGYRDTLQFKILDHGYVKFIDAMGTDADIIRAARMSVDRGFEGWEPHERCKHCNATFGERASPCRQSPTEWNHEFEKKPGDAGLLEFMYRERHTTPFEMCELKLEVQAPIMVFREWHRHRTQSYSEFSARYSQMPNLHYLPEPSRIQKQHASMKQGSAEALPPDEADDVLKRLGMEQDMVYKYYDDLVAGGIAKEVARLNTPVSRYSKMTVKTDLWNWLAFLRLRMAPSAQYEIRQFANAVGEIISKLWPRTWALFEEYSLRSATLSATEFELVRRLLSTYLGLGGMREFPEYASDVIAKLGQKRYEAFTKKFFFNVGS
jgi:thymidylate synthase (FAD)